MRRTACVASVICILLSLSSFVFAASGGNGNVQLTAANRAKETMNELLLFWDEKDLYVQTATRHEKSISQVAENITVITAKEIADMNAHTVAEVLNRVTGVFVDSKGQDFGSSSLLYIQGSEDRHVLVMLDGVTWNFLSGGNAETNSIPVQIIDRIEVVKGPASSSWGSSLGGVINIITKTPAGDRKPSGTISASYGEGNSQDYRGEVTGTVGSVGYYLYAGHQDSDGLRNDRFFRNYSLYSKLTLPVSENVKLGLTLGYSEPKMLFLSSPDVDITATGKTRAFFATLSMNAAITRELIFDLALHTFRHTFTGTNNVFGSGFYGAAGDLFERDVYKTKIIDGTAKLIYKRDNHSAVLGFDASHGTLDQTIYLGPFLQSFGLPPITAVEPNIDKWAVFFNDTITLGNFSLTPGLRYDHNSVSGSFTSPSLGLTYKPGEHTILRFSVARGFNYPPLSFTTAGGLFLDPNPDLGPERVWSYQAGIESSITDYLWAKGTVFYNNVTNAISIVSGADRNPPADNRIAVNASGVKRKGVELEAETVPFHNVSVKAGFAYVDISPSGIGMDTHNYEYNVTLKYDDRKSFMAQLFGHYVWWDLPGIYASKYNAFIFDLNVRKGIYSSGKTSAEIFLTAHNLLNGSQYFPGDYKNPKRWIEAGVRFKF